VAGQSNPEATAVIRENGVDLSLDSRGEVETHAIKSHETSDRTDPNIAVPGLRDRGDGAPKSTVLYAPSRMTVLSEMMVGV
jgi:hypothetical protein